MEMEINLVSVAGTTEINLFDYANDKEDAKAKKD